MLILGTGAHYRGKAAPWCQH